MGTFKNILPEIDVLVLGVEARASNMLIILYCWVTSLTTPSPLFYHKVSTSLRIPI